MKKTFKKVGIIIGAQDVVFSKIESDTSAGTTYEDDVYGAPGVVEIALVVTYSEDQVAGDNNPAYAQVKSIDQIEASITINQLGGDGESYLLGRKRDSHGGVITASTDIAPDVAMGFKTLRHDNSMDYLWLFKGMFKPSDEQLRTKEKGKINWAQPKLVGTFVPRLSDNRLRYSVNTLEELATPEFLGAFFDAVVEIGEIVDPGEPEGTEPEGTEP